MGDNIQFYYQNRNSPFYKIIIIILVKKNKFIIFTLSNPNEH